MITEKLVFKTKVDKTFYAMYFGMLALLLFFTNYEYYSIDIPSMFIVLLGWFIVALLFTIASFCFLKIIIDDHYLIVNVVFDIYKVDIKTITFIEKGKTMWFGFHKHGTATKGLTISSQFKNDVYVTPKNEDLFLQKLLEINPDITVNK